MRRAISLIACVAVFAGCSDSFVVAPSTRKSDEHAAKVGEHVSKAQVISKSNRQRTVDVAKALESSRVTATSVVSDIDAAIRSLDLKDYPKVGMALMRAKVGEGMLLEQVKVMQKSMENLVTGTDSMLTELDLAYKENEQVLAENKRLQDQIDPLARSQAKAQAIVDQVNWGFGLGAFIYGFKRILTFGFWGALILVVIVIVLIAIGGPTSVFVLRELRLIFSWWKNRRADK